MTETSAGKRGPSYWDGVAKLSNIRPDSLWRAYADWAYKAWIHNCLSSRQGGVVLKTDLFDETVSEGLVGTLKEFGSRIYGVDLSPEIVKMASQKHPDLLAQQGNVRDLPYPDEYFDLILSNSTLDHFSQASELKKAVEELYRVTKAGGALLVTLDNLSNPVVRLRRRLSPVFLSRSGLAPYYPGVTLTRSGLRELLQEVGFEVSQESYLMHVPRLPAIWFCRLLESLKWDSHPERVVSALSLFDRLDFLPTRDFTGYYVAAIATRP